MRGRQVELAAQAYALAGPKASTPLLSTLRPSTQRLVTARLAALSSSSRSGPSAVDPSDPTAAAPAKPLSAGGKTNNPKSNHPGTHDGKAPAGGSLADDNPLNSHKSDAGVGSARGDGSSRGAAHTQANDRERANAAPSGGALPPQHAGGRREAKAGAEAEEKRSADVCGQDGRGWRGKAATGGTTQIRNSVTGPASSDVSLALGKLSPDLSLCLPVHASALNCAGRTHNSNDLQTP